MGCSPWGREESDTTERLHFHFSLSCIGEGNGNPLQCSCLENPRDRGAWWATVSGVTQSRTRLKRLSRSSSRQCRGHSSRMKCVGVSPYSLNKRTSRCFCKCGSQFDLGSTVPCSSEMCLSSLPQNARPGDFCSHCYVEPKALGAELTPDWNVHPSSGSDAGHHRRLIDFLFSSGAHLMVLSLL